jgi:membrane fusion protein (multidrug efflux system)
MADLEVARRRQLHADKMVSEADLDSAEAAAKQAEAAAEAMRATIAKKTIRAPFAGRLGLRMVNLGEYLDTGKPIVSLQSLSPVYADFSLPQQDLARVQTGMKVRLSADTYGDRCFDGTLSALNPDLDSGTRSLRLRATFDNADQSLRPGMFARVEVLLPSDQPVLVVPATAVLNLPYGETVYVIEPETGTNKSADRLVVRQQLVRTGRARGDLVSIESGLKRGERVVSAGAFKLRPHMPVTENNALVPASSATPHPSEG